MRSAHCHPPALAATPDLLDDLILRLPEVERRTGVKKTHIYALVKKDEFPKPIKLGERASGWLSSEIRQWIQDRIAASRGGSQS